MECRFLILLINDVNNLHSKIDLKIIMIIYPDKLLRCIMVYWYEIHCKSLSGCIVIIIFNSVFLCGLLHQNALYVTEMHSNIQSLVYQALQRKKYII